MSSLFGEVGKYVVLAGATLRSVALRHAFSNTSPKQNLANDVTMARKGSSNAQTSQSRLASKNLILDNGAHSIKAGFSPQDLDSEPNGETDCHVIANCIARSQRDKRTYVGSELLDECWDFGELAFRRPVERGFVVNWESEKAIWERSIVDKRSPLQVCIDHCFIIRCV